MPLTLSDLANSCLCNGKGNKPLSLHKITKRAVDCAAIYYYLHIQTHLCEFWSDAWPPRPLRLRPFEQQRDHQ